MKFTPLRISVIYFLFAILWITTTDNVLEWLVDDFYLLSNLQTVKGFFYVIVTAIALFLMMKSYEKYIAKNQRVLEKQERSLNLALDSGQIATWEYFPEADSYITSDNHNKLFGYSVKESLKLGDFVDRVHKSDVDEFLEKVDDTLKKGKEFNIQYKINLPDGTGRWLWTKGEPTSSNGSVNKVSGITIDITKSKELEQELKIERERLQKLFDRIPVLINFFDQDQNFISFNKYHQDILGWTYEDIEEKSLLELCYPDTELREKVRRDIIQMTKGWKEYEVTTKSGDVRNQLWTNIVLSDNTFVGVGYDITERKKLENQIKSEREELQAIFDKMPVFINLHDDSLNIAGVNKYFEERLGYNNETAKNKDLLKLITTEEGYKKAKKQIAISEGNWIDFELITKDGEKLYSTWTNIKIGEDKSIGIGVDITERKLLEQKIEESRERLHITTTSANVGLWEWYPQTGEVVIDEMWAVLVGFTQEELAPVSIETWNKLVHPEDLKKFEETVETYFAGETDIYEIEVRMKHKDGHWVWILDRGRTVEWDENGNPKRLVGTHVDITDRVNFEQENRLLADVFLNSNTGLSVSNHQTNLLERVNEAYAEMFGYSVDELTGMDIHRLYSENSKDDPKRIIKELTDFGFTIFESELVRKDGTTFSALINLALVNNEDSDSGYRISTVQDITKLKEQQYELKRNRDRLLQSQEIARLGYWSLELDTNKLWWSDIVYGIYDKTPETFSPSLEKYIELTHPDDRTYVEEMINKYINEDSFDLIHRIIKSDGEVGHVQVRGKRFFDEYLNKMVYSGSVLDLTEFKQMELKLQEEQKRFEVAANITSDVIWEWNSVEQQLWWGDGIESVLGYKKEQYENVLRFWQDHIAEEDRERVVTSMENAEKSDETIWTAEYTFLAADGSKRHIVDSAIIIRRDDGSIIRIIGAMVDKTWEMEYQEALKHQSYRFEMIAKSSNDVLYDWDIKTNDIWWSEGWQMRFDIAEEDVASTKKWWENRIHPDNREKVINSLQKATESDVESWIEYYRFKNGRGDYSIVIGKGYFIRDEKGTALNMVGTISDITVDVKAKEELKASEEQYRLLFEQNPIPMMIYDPDSLYYSAVNEVFEQKYGYTEEEILTMKILDICPEDDAEAVKKDVIKNRGKTSFGEWTHIAKNGTRLIVEISASDIFYKGKMQRLVIAHDITEQRKAEERAISAIIEGEERERQRIAKELHDGLGQYLSAANMNLKSVYEDLPSISQKLSDAYGSGLEFLNHAILETRNISQNLLPKAIQDYGLELAVESLINHLRSNNEVDFYFYKNLGDAEIPDKVQINLYRIFQEATNNAIRHGKPERIDVQLVYSNNEVLLMIEDNGTGFDIKDESRFGIGIRSMRTRAGAMAANMDIVSNKGRGTIVTVVVPL